MLAARPSSLLTVWALWKCVGRGRYVDVNSVSSRALSIHIGCRLRHGRLVEICDEAGRRTRNDDHNEHTVSVKGESPSSGFYQAPAGVLEVVSITAVKSGRGKSVRRT